MAAPALPPCPRCESFAPRFAGIEACTRCGLGHTLAGTAAADVQDYVNHDHSCGLQRQDYFAGLCRKYVEGLPAGRALDVGCAQGELVRELEGRGWVAHGIDSFRGFAADGKQFFRASLEEFAQEEPYDLVTMVHSLEHMSDPVGALGRVARLLGKGGHLLIIVPHFGGVCSRMMGAGWHWLNPEHHVYHYTIAGLANVLHRGGFTVETVNTYSGYAPSPGQIYLSQRDFYDRGIGSIQPLRSLVFRANTLLRPAWNRVVDWRKDGLELQVLAAPASA